MLCAEQISIVLRTRPVLRAVSLSVPCGSFVALLGPNGAGKSTLLRALAGDIAPQAGRITMAGRPLSEWSLRERAQQRAVLEQDYALSFPLRVLDVVLLGRMPHQDRAPAPRPAARLDDLLIARAALDAVELGQRATDAYDILSGGQKQLVQLARALAQIWDASTDAARPRYLLLDEPTASLDLRFQHLILSRAKRLAAEGVAVLAILHDINLAAQYADTIALLHDGAIVAQGRPSAVLQPDIIHAVFDVHAARIDSAGRPVIVPQTPAHRAAGPSPLRYTTHADISPDHPVRPAVAPG